MDWHVSAAWIDVWLSITFPFLKGRAWNFMSTLDIAVDDLTHCELSSLRSAWQTAFDWNRKCGEESNCLIETYLYGVCWSLALPSVK